MGLVSAKRAYDEYSATKEERIANPEGKNLVFKCCDEEFYHCFVDSNPFSWLPVYRRCYKCRTPYALYPKLEGSYMVKVDTDVVKP